MNNAQTCHNFVERFVSHVQSPHFRLEFLGTSLASRFSELAPTFQELRMSIQDYKHGNSNLTVLKSENENLLQSLKSVKSFLLLLLWNDEISVFGDIRKFTLIVSHGEREIFF